MTGSQDWNLDRGRMLVFIISFWSHGCFVNAFTRLVPYVALYVQGLQ